MPPTATFSLTWHSSSTAGRLALLTLVNGADHRTPTVISSQTLASLDARIDEIVDADASGVLITGKPFIFCAGADTRDFVGVDAQWARRGAAEGHRVLGRLRQLTVPTLAAINGLCLGGGLELALSCDARTVSTAAGRIAFPEVFLSIFPAWSGSQLVPRLIGAEAAIECVVANPLRNNRMLRPDQAHRMGLADRLLPAPDLLDGSVALLEQMVTGDVTFDRDVAQPDDLDAVFTRARASVDAAVHGATPAPYVALDLLAFAAGGGDLDEGLERELDAIAKLLPARQAQAALYSFDLTQRRARRQPGRPDVDARTVRSAAVVGAGYMGAQLAALLLHGLQIPVVLTDIDDAVLDRARGIIDKELGKRVERGRLDEGKARFLASLVTYTGDYDALADVDLVVEAVSERLDLKRKIFADVEAAVGPECVLATNTSSLSVAAMGADLEHPERVIGLHFFTPVARMPLVEIVRTAETDDVTAATGFDVVSALRKTGVACADRPAFVVNRILTRLMAECARMVGGPEDFTRVDDAVTALGLPMGTFELLGMVGFAVAAHVADTLHDAFPDRFPSDRNFAALVDADVSRVYDPDADGQVPHDEVVERWSFADDPAGSPDEIQRGVLEACADEIRHMLDEGVVDDPRDIDTCMLLGAGWPFFNGGICLLLDQTGVSTRLFDRPFLTDTSA